MRDSKMIFVSRLYNSLKDAYTAMRIITREDYVCEVTFKQVMEGKWQYEVTYVHKDDPDQLKPNDIFKEDKSND